MITRDEALSSLRRIVVALGTRMLRGVETEVGVGPADRTAAALAVSVDNWRMVPRSLFIQPIANLGPMRYALAFSITV